MPTPDGAEVRFTEDGGCFGCSQTNPSGLRMRFRRRGEGVHAAYTVADQFHGAPGVVHGGIVATLLDEVSCVAIFALSDHWVVTGEITVRYERACPVDAALEMSARVADRSHPRYWVVEGAIHAGGERVARSTGKFFLRDHSPIAP
ncbi:MAG: PaaI family thioesterase [bacterium]|nr:PaaI family thioesterase [bacterium]